MIDGVQAVFMVAAPLAALALLIVLFLPEAPLKTSEEHQAPEPRAKEPARPTTRTAEVAR